VRVGAGAAVRGVVRRLSWVDAVVVVALGAWWFFGPVLYDDGWVLATVSNFRKSGAFSNYYDIFDAQYPLGFVQFLSHFGSSRVSTSLVWMRFPVLILGVATWTLLRSYLARLRPEPGLVSRVVLACVFLAFWFAWLSTLRPEPMVALLAVAVLVAVQRFSHTAALGSLAVAVLAATVAVTIHPEGVIAVAPLLVVAPTLWRWTRERGRLGVISLVAVVLIAAAALLLLVTADTDLSLWRQNQHLFSANGGNARTWRDELFRYELLLDTKTIWGPVVRRASVLFGLVAVVLFVSRPARRRDVAFDLPVLSLTAGVVLMALTPSKWPWQLGALGGFAALSVATELGRLGLEPVGSESRARRSLLVVGLTVVGSAIAWRGGDFFGDFSVLDVDFGRGGSGFLGIDLSSPVPWLLAAAGALVVCVVVAAFRRRLTVRAVVDQWLAVSGMWAVPIAVGVVVATTFGLFVTDAFASSPGWSLPRQNYDDLTGRTCGLADDIDVADPTTGALLDPDPLPAEATETADTTGLPDTVAGARLDFSPDGSPAPPPGVDLDPRWGSRITGDQDTGVFFSPWFAVGPGATTDRVDRPGLALFTAGKPASAGNVLLVQFGRRDGPAIHPLAVQRIAAPDSDTTWQPSALDPPARADRLRVIAVDAAPDGWLAFSTPRGVGYQPLAAVLTRPHTTALIGPAVRFYFPCATNPAIQHGVAQAPDYLVAGVTDRGAGLWPQSPTADVVDLYPSRRLLTRTTNGTNVEGLDIDHIAKHPAPGEPTPFEG
jgi:Mycobacterial cell wall arabinan synthesis protein/EmbC C-terminal domain